MRIDRGISFYEARKIFASQSASLSYAQVLNTGVAAAAGRPRMVSTSTQTTTEEPCVANSAPVVMSVAAGTDGESDLAVNVPAAVPALMSVRAQPVVTVREPAAASTRTQATTHTHAKATKIAPLAAEAVAKQTPKRPLDGAETAAAKTAKVGEAGSSVKLTVTAKSDTQQHPKKATKLPSPIQPPGRAPPPIPPQNTLHNIIPNMVTLGARRRSLPDRSSHIAMDWTKHKP